MCAWSGTCTLPTSTGSSWEEEHCRHGCGCAPGREEEEESSLPSCSTSAYWTHLRCCRGKLVMPGKCQAYPAFPMHSAVEAGSHGKSMHHFLHFCDMNLKWFLPKGAGILSWEQKNVDWYQQPKQNTSHLLWSALSPTEGRLPGCWQLIHSSAPCPALGSTGKYWSWCTPEI